MVRGCIDGLLAFSFFSCFLIHNFFSFFFPFLSSFHFKYAFQYYQVSIQHISCMQSSSFSLLSSFFLFSFFFLIHMRTPLIPHPINHQSSAIFLSYFLWVIHTNNTSTPKNVTTKQLIIISSSFLLFSFFLSRVQTHFQFLLFLQRFFFIFVI